MAEIKVDIALKDGNKLTVNKSAINSISSLTQSNTDPNTIFYGVVSNTGDIEISDKQGNIKQLVENGLIDSSGVNVDIFANGNQIQSHISGDSGYQNNILNISLTDDLSNISTTVYSNPEESNYLSDLTGLQLLAKICEKSSPKIDVPISGSNNLPYTESDMLNIYSYLNMIKFKDIDLSLGNMNPQELLNHFCNATQLNLFNGNDGNDVVVAARPVVSGIETSNLNNRPILVQKKDVFDEGTSSVFLKNKIKQVNLSIDDVTNSSKILKTLDVGSFLEASTSDKLEQLNSRSLYVSDEITYAMVLDQKYHEVYTDKNGNVWHIYITNFKTDDYVKGSGFWFTCRYENNKYDFSFDNASEYYVNNIQTIDEIKGLIDNSLGKPFVCAFYNSKIYEGFVNNCPVVYACKEMALSGFNNNYPFKFWIGTSDVNESTVYSKSKTETKSQFGSLDSGVKTNEIISFDANPFLTSTSVVSVYGKDVPLYEYIAMNILDDYINGIKTKTVQIACSDLYYTHNLELKAKNWSVGNVLNVADVINLETETNVDGSYIDWKVTGREFTFNSVPMLKLELQECIRKEKLY